MGDGRPRKPRGQALVEFALILPVFLLLTFAAIDFGRVFLGWINLQNMARIAANYAANNASEWDDTTRAIYAAQIENDARAINCDMVPEGGRPVPDPTFPGGTEIGGTAEVRLTCRFHVITPIMSDIVGSEVNVGASSIFPIKSGMTTTPVADWCNFSATPTTPEALPADVVFTDLSTVTTTSWRWDFGDGASSTEASPTHTYVDPDHTAWSVRLTVTSAEGTCTVSKHDYISLRTCTVPEFVDQSASQAPTLWGTANFTGTITYDPRHGPRFTGPAPSWIVGSQSLVAGSPVPCGADITLSERTGH